MPRDVRSFFPAMSLMLIVCFGSVYAHDLPYQRINEISLELEQQPDNVDLYMQRGELYRHTSQWDLALLDFESVLLLDPAHVTVNFHRGRLLFEAAQYRAAKIALDHFLQDQPHHLEALMVRARVLRKLGQPLLAVRDYTRVSSMAAQPTAVLLMENAQAWVEVGGAYVDLALRGLDWGTQELGPVLSLESCALEIEVEHQRYEAALVRIDRILQGMTRKETWLVRRGAVLEKAGRVQEARASYQDALRAIHSLPGRLQRTPASQALAATLHDLLESGLQYLQ